MFSFIPLDQTQRLPLLKEYLDNIPGVRDDFWEEHVLDAQAYLISREGDALGMLCMHGGENLSLFYMRPRALRYAQAAFDAALNELRPRYAYAPTFDELFVSLCMDRRVSIDMQAYFFRQGDAPVRPPEFPRALLRMALPSDKEVILDTEGVEENIRMGRYYIMCDGGEFLGQGFFNRHTLIPGAASIGMSVHPAHRQKGVGRSIIMHLADMCRERGITPYCGCWYYNGNSKLTLESAGFVTKTRLLKVWFAEHPEGV